MSVRTAAHCAHLASAGDLPLPTTLAPRRRTQKKATAALPKQQTVLMIFQTGSLLQHVSPYLVVLSLTILFPNPPFKENYSGTGEDTSWEPSEKSGSEYVIVDVVNLGDL